MDHHTKEHHHQQEQKKIFSEVIDFPQEVSLSCMNNIVSVKGAKGQVRKKLDDKRITLAITGNSVTVSSTVANKRAKTMVNSFAAHLNNLIQGVQNPYVYKLKICSGHFPMNVSVEKQKLVIKNFFGEKVPRTYAYNPDVTVKIEGDIIVVESSSKELASQTAASIEQLTRRPGFDTRIFQDGCHIIEKAGKALK